LHLNIYSHNIATFLAIKVADVCLVFTQLSNILLAAALSTANI
jgi:hypothetical protein